MTPKMDHDTIVLDSTDAQAGRKTAPRGRDWVPGGYKLRDAWVPIAHAMDVTKRPDHRLLHSQSYFLWRDGEKARAAEFHPEELPAKRGKGSFLTAGSGEYPTTEKYGMVWVWYGDPANADVALIPDVPYLPPNGGLPRYMHATVQFYSCSELSLENLLDLTHADFLHTDFTGNEIAESDDIEVLSTPETVTMIRTKKRQETPSFMRMAGVKEKYQDFRGVIHVHLRSGVALAFGRFEPGFTVPLFHPSVPESRYRSRVNSVFNTSAHPIPFKWMMPRAGRTIGPQDNYMLRPQNPRYMAADERADLHSRFDGAGVRYRFAMQALADRQASGDYAYLEDPAKDVTELLRIKRVEKPGDKL